MLCRRSGRARLQRSDLALARARSLRSDRAPARARSLCSDRALARARSLRSDRAKRMFCCCAAILFELLFGDSRFFRKAFRKEQSITKSELLSLICFTPSLLLYLRKLSTFKSLVLNMSSSHGDKRSSGADSGFSGRSAFLPSRSSLLSREISSSPSRERTGSSRRRVTVLLCTGRCSGSWDRGRNSAGYGNSRGLGRSGNFRFKFSYLSSET
uniref:Uncharacterized protein n=1 Tax=Brassica oleracea var. oleracea TaxID=109376 RepID=A0A0D3ASU2_BRAOL